MMEKVYYGEHGEYGPYTPQEDGLPDAGEVHRDFRSNVAILSVEKYVKEYNKKIVEYNERPKRGKPPRKKLKPITASWIYNMEKYNLVPTDPDRRRIIAEIIKAPLWLFGLVKVEEVMTQSAQPITPSIIKKQTVDLQPYEESVRTSWRFHYTSTAQGDLYTIKKAIRDLEIYEKTFDGKMQKKVRELLYSYLLLADAVVCEQRDYATSFIYANSAIRVAKSMQVDAQNTVERSDIRRLLARAQYSRGLTTLFIGLYGESDEQGLFQLNKTKIQDAITDFEEAERYGTPALRGMLYKELARAQGFRQQSALDLMLAQNTIEKAEGYVGVTDFKDDPYLQILYEGQIGGLTKGNYLLGSAIAFNVVGRPEKAKDMLGDLDRLNASRIPRDHTRQNAWTDIIRAQTALGMGDLDLAIDTATNALLICRDIQSFNNITIIKDIHARLLHTTYRNNYKVKHLGRLLATPE